MKKVTDVSCVVTLTTMCGVKATQAEAKEYLIANGGNAIEATKKFVSDKKKHQSSNPL